MWCLRSFSCCDLEIRPLWDWKSDSSMLHRYRNLLKSDHYGIERCTRRVKIILIIFLKSDHYGIESLRVLQVVFRNLLLEIRPLWDWKFIASSLLSTEAETWNQTIMGLKGENPGECPENHKDLKSDHYGIESRSGWQRCEISNPLEIRPLWDWKVDFFGMSPFAPLLEIRPLWDWKLSPPSWEIRLLNLKSDHYGIESL